MTPQDLQLIRDKYGDDIRELISGKECWLFTLTFKSNYKCAKKYELIRRIPEVFETVMTEWMSSFRNCKPILIYTVEYHTLKYGQMKGRNDVTSPHVHGLMIHENLSESASAMILARLKAVYGRSQFFIKENEDEVVGWYNYCVKQVIENDNTHDYQHYYRHELKPDEGVLERHDMKKMRKREELFNSRKNLIIYENGRILKYDSDGCLIQPEDDL